MREKRREDQFFYFLFKPATPLIHNKRMHGLEVTLILDQVVMLAQSIQESVMEVSETDELIEGSS